MGKQLDENELATSDELLMSQMIQLDTLSQLLIKKRMVTEEQFFTKLK